MSEKRTVILDIGTLGFVVLSILAALGLARVFEFVMGAI